MFVIRSEVVFERHPEPMLEITRMSLRMQYSRMSVFVE